MNGIFITGASKGIGKAIAQAFLQIESYTVYGISRSNSIQHDRFNFVETDLSCQKDVISFEFPDPDFDKVVLINNAGSLGEMKHNGDFDNHAIAETYILNVISPHILMNQFMKQFKEVEGDKIIINISSGAATSIYDGWSVYCASKGAINRMSEVAAYEQELSITENPFKIFAIAPGVVETQMQEAIRTTDAKHFSRVEKFHELKDDGKLYDANDVAKRFVDYIESPDTIEGVISRIVV